MGAHRLQDDRSLDVAARVVGRGALATSLAFALAGTGAGLAAAAPGNGNGNGHGNGHGSEDGYAERSTDCTPGDDAFVDGLLGDLGLSGSSGEPCATDGADAADSGAEETSGETTPDPSSSTDSDAEVRRAAATAEPAEPTNPVDIPPAPGETKIIDLPDTPTG